MAIDLPDDYEAPDGLLLASFADQFAQKGIDADRSQALAEIFARESIDPSLVDERSDADKELIANAVDQLNNPDGSYLAEGMENIQFGDRVKRQDVDRFYNELRGEDVLDQSTRRAKNARRNKSN